MKQGQFARALALTVTGLLLLCGAKATPALPLVTAESNGELYAGQISPYIISVSAPPYTNVTLLWEVTARERLLGRGEYRVQMGERRQVSIELPIETPPLNRGHSITATMTLAAVDGTTALPSLVHKRELTLYGPEPLALEADSFRRMHINLYDPVGTTAAMFSTAGIPYTRVEEGDLQRLSPSVFLVIGSGLELERRQDQGAWLHRLALKGRRVLFLGPVAGRVTFAPAQGELLSPISSIRLDVAGAMPFFPPHYNSAAVHRGDGLALRQRRGISSVEVADTADSRWYWFSLTYGDSNGLLAIVMWPFATDFARDPAMSLAFGRLLQHVVDSPATEQ